LARDGYWKEADAACRRALRLHPDDPYPPSWLANALHQHGRDEDAVVMYHKAIESDRDFVSAHYNLGVLYARAGRHEEAARAFRAAKRLSPGSFALPFDLARELSAAGRPTEAIAELQALRAAGAPNVSVSLNLA